MHFAAMGVREWWLFSSSRDWMKWRSRWGLRLGSGGCSPEGFGAWVVVAVDDEIMRC